MLSMLDKKIMERYDNRGIFSVGGTTINIVNNQNDMCIYTDMQHM